MIGYSKEIEPEDLRKGNYVYLSEEYLRQNSLGIHQEPYVVIDIHMHDGEYYVYLLPELSSGKGGVTCFIKEIEGIPISKEWLEGLSMTPSEKVPWVYEIAHGIITVNSGNHFIFHHMGHVCPGKYVHELQNLIYITTNIKV